MTTSRSPKRLTAPPPPTPPLHDGPLNCCPISNLFKSNATKAKQACCIFLLTCL